MSEGFARIEQFLENHYALRYNIISNEIESKRIDIEDSGFVPLNENNLYRHLKNNHINVTLSNLYSLLKSDFVQNYNPFIDYFESLPKWNKSVDYISLLCEKIHCKDRERFNTQFKKMLVRTVACALNDDIFNKQAFILVHQKQNSGKSTFCRWLCPPTLKDHFTENIGLDKDSLISLSENFIINLDELATLSKVEINQLKSIFSKQYIKVRKPYDKRAMNVPRRASFFGSTNNPEFLNDHSGSVRWLCFEIENIDWSYKKEISIDSIWSQAYSLWISGFKYELTQAEIKENEEANKEFHIVTPEMEIIQKHFQQGVKNEDEFYTAFEIHEYLNKLYMYRIKVSTVGIGKALKALGFIQEQKFRVVHQVKGYYLRIIE